MKTALGKVYFLRNLSKEITSEFPSAKGIACYCIMNLCNTKNDSSLKNHLLKMKIDLNLSDIFGTNQLNHMN